MGPASLVRASFEAQAQACRTLGSPFNALLCSVVGQRLMPGTAVGDAILGWSGDPRATGDALALRLVGGLHALVLSGRSARLRAVYPPNVPDVDALWDAVAEALVTHEAALLAWLGSAPQTNEVRRSGILVPGFLTIAGRIGLPFVVSELGASAGLNLFWDRYGYRFGNVAWGDAASGVQIKPEWQGPPIVRHPLVVTDRAACDLNPLDPNCAEDRLRVLAYIWPDQTDRLERTAAALEIARRSEHVVERADAVEWLEKRLAHRFDGHVHVVYHSIFWQYMPLAARIAAKALIDAAGNRADDVAPLAWLRMEADGKAPGAALKLRIWPGQFDETLARADYHGRWITWLGRG